MLRFDAYFKQTVHECPNEHYRIREVRIFYYLEDDSISVVEPVAENRSLSLSLSWLYKVVQRVYNITTTEKQLHMLLQIMLTLPQTRADKFEFCHSTKEGRH